MSGATPAAVDGGFLLATVSIDDLERTVGSWRDVTGYEVVAEEAVGPTIAALWGLPELAETRQVVLRAPGTDRGMLRLVDHGAASTPDAPSTAPIPLGPVGVELYARSTDEVFAHVYRHPHLTAVSAPRDFDLRAAGGGIARAFRMVATGGLICFVNTVRWLPAGRHLPELPHKVGRIWNMAVTATDAGAVLELSRILGMPVLFDGVLDQDSVRETNGLPDGFAFRMLVLGAGRPGEMIEYQVHPREHVVAWPRPAGSLRPGAVSVTVGTSAFDDLLARLDDAGVGYRGPVTPSSAPYDGRRVVALNGPGEEMIEIMDLAPPPGAARARVHPAPG